MADPSPTSLLIDEHDLFPTHEEDSVPQGGAHFFQFRYLTLALETCPAEIYVVGDHCVYWDPDDKNLYVAPDVVVTDEFPPAVPRRVYLAWQDPPLLLVAEVGSELTLDRDLEDKVAIYEQVLCVPEYLFAFPPTGELRLWRLIEGRYVEVAPSPEGRVWSAQLQVWFGYDEDGLLRAFQPEGKPIPTYLEAIAEGAAEAERRMEAKRRADAEARRADDEARQRQEAEAHSAALEQRLAELAAKMERLRQPPGS